MKLSTLMFIVAITLLAALAISAPLAAQDRKDHKQHKHHHYQLIDLGTFGGPGSGLFDAQRMFTKDGTLVGWSDTAVPDPNAPKCFDPDCVIQHGFRWRDGVMTDLGALSGVNNSQAESVNEHGLIVGLSQNGSIDPYLSIPATDAVAWANGEIFNLGTLGGFQGAALAINDAGQGAGVSTNTVPDQYSFLGGTQSRAFLSEHGTLMDLGTLGGSDSFGQFINKRGQIAGFSYTSSTAGPLGIPPFDPFLWDRDTGMKDVGNFGGTACNPFYLSDHGELVGNMNLAGDQTAHPFLWNGKKLIDLGTFSGDYGQANWVNEDGDAVGFSFYSDGTMRAALWPNGKKIKDLGTVHGDNCSAAWDINAKGQTVGLSFADTGFCSYPSATITALHAVMWENGSVVDLNAAVARDSDLRLVIAQQINDRGEIAGVGILPGVPLKDFEFHSHAFVLIPCDEKHPDVEGCDYSTVDADAALASGPEIRLAPEHEPPPALWQRDNRFHVPSLNP